MCVRRGRGLWEEAERHMRGVRRRCVPLRVCVGVDGEGDGGVLRMMSAWHACVVVGSGVRLAVVVVVGGRGHRRAETPEI